MLEHPLSYLHYKQVTAVLLIVVLLIEMSKGYFKEVSTYVKTFSPRPYVFPLFILIVATLLIIVFADIPLIQWIRNQNSALAGWVAEFGSLLGRSSNCFTFLGLCYLAAYVTRMLHARQLIFGALLASFLTAVGVTIFKFTLLRARPDSELGVFSFFNWQGIIEDDRAFQSFPSGDVGIVAGAAAYFFYLVRNYALKFLLMLLPVCTAVARISLNRHWPSDAFFSIGLGLMIGKFVWDYKGLRFKK
jgi:membrane-associated phospholipid phosphatase